MLVYSLLSIVHFRELAPAKKEREKRATESVQVVKNVELEVLMKSQAKKSLNLRRLTLI
jgi:hypothetical protein